MLAVYLYSFIVAAVVHLRLLLTLDKDTPLNSMGSEHTPSCPTWIAATLAPHSNYGQSPCLCGSSLFISLFTYMMSLKWPEGTHNIRLNETPALFPLQRISPWEFGFLKNSTYRTSRTHRIQYNHSANEALAVMVSRNDPTSILWFSCPCFLAPRMQYHVWPDCLVPTPHPTEYFPKLIGCVALELNFL